MSKKYRVMVDVVIDNCDDEDEALDAVKNTLHGLSEEFVMVEAVFAEEIENLEEDEFDGEDEEFEDV